MARGISTRIQKRLEQGQAKQPSVGLNQDPEEEETTKSDATESEDSGTEDSTSNKEDTDEEDPVSDDEDDEDDEGNAEDEVEDEEVPMAFSAFEHVLKTVVGLTNDAFKCLTDNGITDGGLLVSLDDDALSDLYKFPEFALNPKNGGVSLLVKQRFRVFHYWLQKRKDKKGQIVNKDLRVFTAQVMEDENEAMKSAKSNKKTGPSSQSSSSSNSDSNSGQKIAKFSGQIKHYRKFKEELMAKLFLMKNTNGVPFAYLLRRKGGTLFKSAPKLIKQLCIKAPLEGKQFDLDNADLYNHFIIMLEDGPARSSARQFNQNGRDAILNMFDHYESEETRRTIAAQAEDKIQSLVFHGNKKNFTLEDYYQQHADANRDYAEYHEKGEKSVKDQIQAYIHGIKHTLINASAIQQYTSKTDCDTLQKFHQTLYQMATNFIFPAGHDTNTSNKTTRQVSGVKRGGGCGGGGRGFGGGRGNGAQSNGGQKRKPIDSIPRSGSN
jgi:hypothetical protein